MIKKDVINVGLIGLGGMANAHRKMISELEHLYTGAVCDVNEERLNHAGDAEGVPQEKRFKDLEALIADPDVDAVISIVPNDLHAKVLRLCIQYQKPVMSEKPFTLNFDEAKDLAELYEQQPIPCMIGFSYRYVPSFRYVKKLIQENKIGPIRHMAVRYLQQFGSPLFERPYAWRFNKAVTGTGALGDLGAHMIDSARFFVGEFRSVSARMETFVKMRKDPNSGEMKKVDVDDFASFQAVLENGVIGNFVATRNAVGSDNQHEVTVYGDYGTIHVNCERPEEINLCIQNETGEKIAFKTEKVPAGYKKNQLQDFVDLITNNQQQGTPTFYDGYQNQKVLDRIIQSAESGESVKID
ncbi:putative dehydrogenase [Melghirimyces profundicolus]|uniref:Putative dehydrogenase n=1 Tax=Melghirimyces profundicolus TaxID=1242148 RepID=A0A2T6BZ33_9BACL|nr:Gfo/Idh/MocA family oxidoreductase [Melghirimyces profundicolus]PTX61330.1 putative dehydrogenase [Melghirimyces profundicolus]